MRLVASIPESTMVATFLKAELDSERFAEELKRTMQKLRVPESIIATPNLQDKQENQIRAKVLGDYRGYKQNREIFTNFPENLAWYLAELNRAEIGNLHYVDYSYWNELTDNTHLVKDAVKNIQDGKIVFNVPNDRFLTLAEKIGNQEHDFEPIIVWGKDEYGALTILEGHLRATALGLAGDKTPKTIKAILGLKR